MAELHVQRKRNNYWWVWILVLILIAAAAFYYYTNYYKKDNTTTESTTGFTIRKNNKAIGSSNFLQEVKNVLNDNSLSKRESHPLVFLN